MKNILGLHYKLLLGHPFGQLSEPLIKDWEEIIVTKDSNKPDIEYSTPDTCRILRIKGFQTNEQKLLKVFKNEDANYVLAVDVTSAYGKKTVTVMTIPVKLRNLSGQETKFVFYPDSAFPPIINTDLLESEGNVPPHCIGKAENFVRFDFSQLEIESDDWESWINVAQKMFEAICDTTIEHLVHHEPLNMEGADLHLTLRRVQADKSANQHLIKLYNEVLTIPERTLEQTSLRMVAGAYDPTSQGANLKDDFLIEVLQKRVKPSLAHMDECTGEDTGDYRHRELFALDNTQRGVVSVATHMNSGDVLAVNGPPGSGKTAMLKAVISHQYVNAAISEGPCPIVVGVGGTNQSVTNIVNAFPNVMYKGKGPTLMHMKRWIPGPDNYGTYFPSRKVISDMSEELKEVTVMGEIDQSNKGGIARWIGKSSALNDPTKLGTLEQSFIFHAHSHFGVSLACVESCVAHIHSRLVSISDEVNALYQQLVDEFDKGFETHPRHHAQFEHFFDEKKHSKMGAEQIELLYTLVHGSDKEKVGILKEVCREHLRDNKIKDDIILSQYEHLVSMAKVVLADRAVDLLVRSELFHYAARYWEGRYLLSCAEHFLIYASPSNLESALRRMCMITPILVSTVQSAPTLFAYAKPYGMSTQPYLMGRADLLIIDEAGQADIRGTLPLLALSKKTIAVGDIAQIPPVVQGVTPLQEQALYHMLRIGKSNKHTSRLFVHAVQNQLLPSLNGSILHVLRQVSRYHHQGLGMTLRGHYRCQETLSQFCNELVYDNSIFIIPPLFKAKGPFNPLSWVSSASPTQKVGTSHINAEEAKMMVDWLIEQWPTIYDHYNNEGKSEKRLPDLVGIISPYKEQSLVFIGSKEDESNVKGKKQGLLHKALVGRFSGKHEITLDDIEKMKVGTVNALQGAEKPIILFSGTKSDKYGGGIHYRGDTYILNVAVSRAKECFVAFICEQTFGIPEDKENLLKPEDPQSDSVGYLGYYIGKRGHRLFPRSVVIIESDNKIDKLQAILGKPYKILSTRGKVLSLHIGDENALSVEQGLFPNYHYVQRSTGKKVDDGQLARNTVDAILKQCAGADIDEIILATDDDFVGEHIAWHMHALFKQHQPALLSKIKRVRLRGLTEDAVRKAFKEKEEINMARASAEMVREILDLLLARKLTEIGKQTKIDGESDFSNFALEKRLIKETSDSQIKGIGRVKASILALLYEHLKKQVESINHPTKAPVTISVNGKKLKGQLIQHRPNGETQSISKTIEYVRSKGATISKSELWKVKDFEFIEDATVAPDASTLNVMRENSKAHGLSPLETYQALTSLYEGESNDTK